MDSVVQGNLPGFDNEAAAKKDGGPTQNLDISPGPIWILGAGRFGHIAAERLASRYPQTGLVVVDRQVQRLREFHEASGVSIHQEDAITFIAHRPLADNQWIVPAVPVHVACLWLMERLGGEGEVQPLVVPTEVDEQVPNPYRVTAGAVYASLATFRCPDTCSEPEGLCTHTGQPRPGNLYDRLAAIEVQGFQVVVIRSWQLAPGVGGFRGEQLHAAAGRIHARPGRWIIATSCRCHAVIDALVFQRD